MFKKGVGDIGAILFKKIVIIVKREVGSQKISLPRTHHRAGCANASHRSCFLLQVRYALSSRLPRAPIVRRNAKFNRAGTIDTAGWSVFLARLRTGSAGMLKAKAQ
jgi:hypothetical protein